MNFNGEPVYNFNFKKIEMYYDNLPSNTEKMEYLSSINKAISLADAIGHKIPDDFMERFIGKLEALHSQSTKTIEIITGVKQAFSDFAKVLGVKSKQVDDFISNLASQKIRRK